MVDVRSCMYPTCHIAGVKGLSVPTHVTAMYGEHTCPPEAQHRAACHDLGSLFQHQSHTALSRMQSENRTSNTPQCRRHLSNQKCHHPPSASVANVSTSTSSTVAGPCQHYQSGRLHMNKEQNHGSKSHWKDPQAPVLSQPCLPCWCAGQPFHTKPTRVAL
jgi:hypothetical protein